jgi:hypothetical protein
LFFWCYHLEKNQDLVFDVTLSSPSVIGNINFYTLNEFTKRAINDIKLRRVVSDGSIENISKFEYFVSICNNPNPDKENDNDKDIVKKQKDEKYYQLSLHTNTFSSRFFVIIAFNETLFVNINNSKTSFFTYFSHSGFSSSSSLMSYSDYIPLVSSSSLFSLKLFNNKSDFIDMLLFGLNFIFIFIFYVGFFC